MNITATPQPAKPGEPVIICVFTIPANTVVYLSVVFYGSEGQIVFAKGYRVTAAEPCKTITVPANASSGTVEDIDEQMQALEILIE